MPPFCWAADEELFDLSEGVVVVDVASPKTSAAAAPSNDAIPGSVI